MHLSKKSDYALRAMVELAVPRPAVHPIKSREIAEKHGIPIHFLEQILHHLKHAGLVNSHLGTSGGYTLAKAPQYITFGEIVRLFEGSIAPIGCVDPAQPSPCSDMLSCRFHQVMARLRDAMAGVMDHTTLADVAGPQILGVHPETAKVRS